MVLKVRRSDADGICSTSVPAHVTDREIKKYWDLQSDEMGAFAVLVGTLHYAGLYVQLSDSTRASENHLSGNGRLGDPV
ncbi:unnamed protein product [Boreogadus saida]